MVREIRDCSMVAEFGPTGEDGGVCGREGGAGVEGEEKVIDKVRRPGLDRDYP